MSTIVGGLRVRLIRDSLYAMVEDALTDKGWFNPARQHTPINMIDTEVPFDQEIPFNTLSMAWQDNFVNEWEIGSRMSEFRHSVYFDFYAEDDVLGMEFSHDLAAILEGRMPSIGRDNNVFTVYDFSQATPPEVTICQIEDVFVDKARDMPKPWQRHWWVVSLSVLDYYGDESDT
jgi:hypothetical protein